MGTELQKGVRSDDSLYGTFLLPRVSLSKRGGGDTSSGHCGRHARAPLDVGLSSSRLGRELKPGFTGLGGCSVEIVPVSFFLTAVTLKNTQINRSGVLAENGGLGNVYRSSWSFKGGISGDIPFSAARE